MRLNKNPGVLNVNLEARVQTQDVFPLKETQQGAASQEQ